MSVEITVAICTLNRRDSLSITLDSLVAQTWDGTWEVLVVDNGSSDNTSEFVRERAADFPCKLSVIVEPTRGLSYARNRALEDANGDAIVFIDDDVTCQEDWLSNHGATFRETQVVGAGGPILPKLPDDAPDWWDDLLPRVLGGPTSRYYFGRERIEIVRPGPIHFPYGANMGIRREVALELGGFRTDLGWGKKMIPAEETEFFRRLYAHGGKIIYVPQAKVIHRIEQSRTTLEYYKRWQRGLGLAIVLMKPPRGFLGHLIRFARQTLVLLYSFLLVLFGKIIGDRTLALKSLLATERDKAILMELATRMKKIATQT